MAYQQTGPTFAFCGTFSGLTIPAARWLTKFNHEMKGYRLPDGTIDPGLYLESLNMLLTDDASDWAESYPDAIRILADPDPTQEMVETFKARLCERFPSKNVEVTLVSFDVELAGLNQRPEESLFPYYKRVAGLMQRIGAKDRPAPTPGLHPLTVLESTMLDTILRAFIRGIRDPEIRKEATRGMASPERSLRNIYTLAEEAKRTAEEVSRLHQEQAKVKENEALRLIPEKTMSKSQLDSLVSSFQTNASSRTVTTWSADSLPELLERLRMGNNSLNPQPHQGPDTSHYAHFHPAAPQPLAIAQNPYRPLPRSGQNDNAPQRPPPPQPFRQRELLDRKESKNPFVNGSRLYSRAKDGFLCVRCGALGKRSNDGHDCQSLPAWEQSYLREAVYGSSPQSNIAAASFGEFDGTAKSWDWPVSSGSSSSGSSQIPTPMSTAAPSPCPSVKSINVTAPAASAYYNAGTPRSFYGEGSAAGKRPAEPEPQVQQQPAPHMRQPQQQVPIQLPPLQFPQPRVPLSQAPQPLPSQPAAERPKRKGQRRVGKKTELQPLVGMFNDAQGKFDSAVSVRSVLSHNKIDMTWMDMLAWSPAMCRELKRLCTQVTSKRAKKSSNPAPPAQPIPFPQAFMPQTLPGSQGQPYQEMVSQVAAKAPDHHTKILKEMVGVEKAFYLQGSVRIAGIVTELLKQNTQADQGSDMNVISTSMVKQLALALRPLSEVGFLGLCMETADYRETLLEYWVAFDFCAEGLWRVIKCFVSPAAPGVSDHS